MYYSEVLKRYNQLNVWGFFFFSYEKALEYDIPTQINSIGLHPEKSVFVCGGEDFKMYKHDYNTGMELGDYSVFSLLIR